MKALIACEFSGRVRDAFIARGHVAVSIDYLPTEAPGPHVKGDVLACIRPESFDLMIAFPPCTYLAVSGARWWAERPTEQANALAFVQALASLPIPRIAIENPIGRLSRAWRRPDQIIQPWQFGHGETKATCFWLKNLPRLHPTDIVDGREARVHRESPGPNRWRNRSRTYQGVADAMAQQWGAIDTSAQIAS